MEYLVGWGGVGNELVELSVVMMTGPAAESAADDEAVGREGSDKVEGLEGGVSVLLTARRRDWTVRVLCAVLSVLGPSLGPPGVSVSATMEGLSSKEREWR